MTAEIQLTEAHWTRPTLASAAIFATKVQGLRARRALIDLVGGPRRLSHAPATGFDTPLALSRSPLLGDERTAERAYQDGKVENLRQAALRFDGLIIPAGAVFSFWRELGPATRDRGFVVGRMLKQGCLTPAVGGGLCQMSNALYEAAVDSGCRIVERHTHSRIVPGSSAEAGRDATVAWNYVDLRFAPDRAMRLSVRIKDGELLVGLHGLQTDGPALPAPTRAPLVQVAQVAARTCATCVETTCFRHEG